MKPSKPCSNIPRISGLPTSRHIKMATSPSLTTTSNSNSNSNTLLTGLNCTGNVHLVIGTNPLAAARCAQSLGAGAHPIVVAPETAELHYGLQQKIDDGSVKWVREEYEDDHLFRLGREEVGRVVDAVFVTAGASRDELGAFLLFSLFNYPSHNTQ